VTDATETPQRTVAVVDDDPTCSIMLDRILSRSGYAVVLFGSGEAFLEAVPALAASVVCLDMGLPGMNGLETLRAVKQLKPALPIILFSAAADEIHNDAMAAGAFACVPKTGAWAELRAAVAAAIASGM
jgi:DNA-binding response OmpR family regulator